MNHANRRENKMNIQTLICHNSINIAPNFMFFIPVESASNELQVYENKNKNQEMQKFDLLKAGQASKSLLSTLLPLLKHKSTIGMAWI